MCLPRYLPGPVPGPRDLAERVVRRLGRLDGTHTLEPLTSSPKLIFTSSAFTHCWQPLLFSVASPRVLSLEPRRRGRRWRLWGLWGARCAVGGKASRVLGGLLLPVTSLGWVGGRLKGKAGPAWAPGFGLGARGRHFPPFKGRKRRLREIDFFCDHAATVSLPQ